LSISNSFAASLLNLIFNATAIADYAENDTTSPAASVWVSLHYDDPGEAGNQSTNEASYTSYARVARSRANSSGGWAAATATDPAQVTPHTTNIDFPESTGAEPNGGGVLDFFATGGAVSGSNAYFWSGAVSPTITVAGAGVTPRLTTATAIQLD
jgi:hypothetical protein